MIASSDLVYRPSRYGAPQRARPLAAVMAALVSALLLLALIAMTALRDAGMKMGGAMLTAMNLSPPTGSKSPTPAKARAANAPHQQQAPLAPKLPPHVDVNNPNKVEWPEGFVHMSRSDLAAADIGKIHSQAAASDGTGETNAGGGGHGGGEGAGGSSFYNVDWYRLPPKSVFDNYLRPGQDPGRWATIDCRMIENYHVEDCHEVAEEPRGSGMARVMREASWQFLVRPPRLNGKALLGTRVRIHYTFTREGRVESAGEAP